MAQSFTPPVEPLVEGNGFRQAQPPAYALPNFSDIRQRLPVPVLPEDSAWERLYWAAWESLWAGLHVPEAGARSSAPFTLSAEGRIEMGPTAFVAQLAGYLPGSFSLIDILDRFYACQHDDGFIGRALVPPEDADYHQPYEPNSTGPNLLAWAEWRYFRLTGDTSRIEAAFRPLVAYHRWCRANRTWPDGLYWTTGYGSGLVNQPRVPGGRFHHLHWTWVDASAQAYLAAGLLERMAVMLGEQELADEMAAERNTLCRAFNDRMWNEAQQFYQDIGPNGEFSPVKSIAAFWALVDGQLVLKERLTPFVQHLRDTWSFRTPCVLPSLAADSEAYNSRTGNGWRGAVRPELTYMVLRGLATTDQHRLAHALAVSHLEAVARVHDDTGALWDNYAPEEPRPGDPAAEDGSGQTAAAVAAMILENVLGISVDWPLRQITWRRHLERAEAYGVRNLPLGNEGTLDLLSQDKTLRIRADAPFTLVLLDEAEVLQTAVPAGTFDLTLD